jgi:hypothetical protein
LAWISDIRVRDARREARKIFTSMGISTVDLE